MPYQNGGVNIEIKADYSIFKYVFLMPEEKNKTKHHKTENKNPTNKKLAITRNKTKTKQKKTHNQTKKTKTKKKKERNPKNVICQKLVKYFTSDLYNIHTNQQLSH